MKKEGHFFKTQNKQRAANMPFSNIFSQYFGTKENLIWPIFDPIFVFLSCLAEQLELINGVVTGYRKLENSETSLDCSFRARALVFGYVMRSTKLSKPCKFQLSNPSHLYVIGKLLIVMTLPPYL